MMLANVIPTSTAQDEPVFTSLLSLEPVANERGAGWTTDAGTTAHTQLTATPPPQQSQQQQQQPRTRIHTVHAVTTLPVTGSDVQPMALADAGAQALPSAHASTSGILRSRRQSEALPRPRTGQFDANGSSFRGGLGGGPAAHQSSAVRLSIRSCGSDGPAQAGWRARAAAADMGGADADEVDGTAGAPAAMDELFAATARRNTFFLWLLGLINNFHYNLVISAASQLATRYGMKRYVALISFCNVFLGIVARLLNTFAASRVSFNLRMTLMSSLTLVGLLLVSLSAQIGRDVDAACFLVVLLGVTCVGTAYSYGETVMLVFVQRYPATMVGAWSSGTGISGVVASVMFVILSATGVDMLKIFLMSMPLALVYWLTFTMGLLAPQKVVHVIFCASPAEGAHPTLSGDAGEAVRRTTKRIVLYRGREDAILAETQAAYRDNPYAFVTEPTTEMVMNLTGISWRSDPNPHGAQGGGVPPAAAVGDVGGEPSWSAEEDGGVNTALFVQAVRQEVAARVAHHHSKQRAGPAAQLGRDQDEMEMEMVSEAGAPMDHRQPRRCPTVCRALPVPPPLQRWWHLHGPAIADTHRAMWWFFFNLSAVYVAEYAAQFMAPFSFYCTSDWKTGGSNTTSPAGAHAPSYNSPLSSSLFWLVYAYPLSQVCYQLGVFISRSSLMVCGLKIAAVGVISILQVANAVGWLVQAKTLFISAKHSASTQVGLSFLLFAWMIFVGLLGGASYVNVFYLILSRTRGQQEEERVTAEEVLMRRLRQRREWLRLRARAAGEREPSPLNDRDGASGGGMAGAVALCHTREDQEGLAAGVASRAPPRDGPGHAKRGGGSRKKSPAKLGLLSTTSSNESGCTVVGQLTNDADEDEETCDLASPASDRADDKAAQGAVGAAGGQAPAHHDPAAGGAGHHGDAESSAFAMGQPPHRSGHTHPPHSGSGGAGVVVGEGAHGSDARGFAEVAPFSPASSATASPSSVGVNMDLLTMEEQRLVAAYRSASTEDWQRRRELAMSTGSLYAMVGICCGTILDVFFTNTIMKHNTSSTC